MLQAHLLQHGLGGGARLCLGLPADQGRQHHVLQRRELRQQVVELEDEPDLAVAERSEEHTSELQSLAYLVCRLLLEKKKKKNIKHQYSLYLTKIRRHVS